ncbi:MAG: trypsin-like peptidase domain-containing protein [Verrucomicrobiae bacterium]|nr:trypsin-like peptidase domain-containing protein [Verrucomicrobiae bacterium]
MMRHSLFANSFWMFCALALAAVSLAPSANAQDETANVARDLLGKHKSSLVVVTVEGRLTTTTDGDPLPDQQQQRRTLGVTIRPTGLIVISNAAVDPSVGLAGQKARLGEKVVTIQSAKTVFEKVEISYGDATVLAGTVIGQDVDADVAFVLPDAAEAERKGKTFEDFIDLGSAALSQPADEVVGLSRSSAAYGYMPTVIVGRVTGVFESDRHYFVTTAGTAQGIPIFATDGRVVGVTLERIIENKRSNILGTLAAGSIQILADLAIERHSKEAGAATPPAAAPAAPAAEGSSGN